MTIGLVGTIIFFICGWISLLAFSIMCSVDSGKEKVRSISLVSLGLIICIVLGGWAHYDLFIKDDIETTEETTIVGSIQCTADSLSTR